MLLLIEEPLRPMGLERSLKGEALTAEPRPNGLDKVSTSVRRVWGSVNCKLLMAIAFISSEALGP